MIDKVEAHLKAVEQFEETTPEAIEAFRVKYAGKKGILNELFAAFREVKNEEKKAYGQVLNQLKTAVSEKVEALKSVSSGGEKANNGLVDKSFQVYFNDISNNKNSILLEGSRTN